MTRLSVERLFSEPPLTGSLPTSLRFAPDGSYVTYLRTAEDDRERLDLWRYDIASRQARCWINASTFSDAAAPLSDAEKAERERRRQFSHGITQYDFNPDGSRLLLPVDGAGYLFDIASEELHLFTPDGTRQTDFRFSPKGSYIAFVRAGNLHLYDLASDRERAVTSDGGGPITNGIADFIAQEEMHRFDGYWWSDDESWLAFTRVDDGPIPISQRYEIDAEDFKVIRQHYPYAGGPNARVQLNALELSTGHTRPIAYGEHDDDYLARVSWAGPELALQTQSRDQQRLVLTLTDPASGAARTALTETSPTWINLHDSFRHVSPDRFLWVSERDGYRHLYLYSGNTLRQLTQGIGMVQQVLYANERCVVFSGWFESPAEQHVYRLGIGDLQLQRLSESSGWHDAAIDRAGQRLLLRRSSLADPGQVLLLELDSKEPAQVIAEDRIQRGHPYFPFLKAHAQPELGTCTAADGQTLHYRLTRPTGRAARRPVIVYVYGGPGVQRVKNEWPPLLLQLFAQNGFGVLELDNRGSSNRGRAFEAGIYRRMGCIEVQDQVAGAEFLRGLDWVDGNRIGVFGHSYGGYMTLMCLCQAPDIFKAGVAAAPVTDWRLYDTHYTERYLGTPQANASGYLASSVFPYLAELKGRLLLMHGMADDNVLFTNSTKLMKALQSQHIQFELMTYPGSKHALQERDVSIHRFNLIVDFFRRNL